MTHPHALAAEARTPSHVAPRNNMRRASRHMRPSIQGARWEHPADALGVNVAARDRDDAIQPAESIEHVRFEGFADLGIVEAHLDPIQIPQGEFDHMGTAPQAHSAPASARSMWKTTRFIWAIDELRMPSAGRSPERR
jgi:hypothetical protein